VSAYLLDISQRAFICSSARSPLNFATPACHWIRSGGDQAVLAVLLLLPELGYLIPWGGKIHEFAEVLQPPGVSAFTPDGRSASARDGRPDGMARNADRIRKLIRAENGGRELQVPYARSSTAVSEGGALYRRRSDVPIPRRMTEFTRFATRRQKTHAVRLANNGVGSGLGWQRGLATRVRAPHA
jgi:hypothetical protein